MGQLGLRNSMLTKICKIFYKPYPISKNCVSEAIKQARLASIDKKVIEISLSSDYPETVNLESYGPDTIFNIMISGSNKTLVCNRSVFIENLIVHNGNN